MDRPNCIVLFVVDCLRADHLSCYGYPRATSPEIDQLARQGVRFESCYPQGFYTFASHVSMLSSVPQSMHRLQNGETLKYDFRMIPDYLRDAGYATAGFVSNGILAGDFGFQDHFEHYDDGLSPSSGVDETYSRSSAETAEHVVSWIEKEGAGNTFLFIHLNDCHAPYTPPEPYRSMFIADDMPRTGKTLPIQRGFRNVIRPECAVEGRSDVDFYISQYDGALRQVSSSIKQITDCLARFAPRDETLLILTGDHGEGLGEHDYYFMHGTAFYEEFIRVPLIVAGPGIPVGSVVSPPARHIDLLPTVLDLIGANSRPDYIQGQSLLPLLAGNAPVQARDLFELGRNSAYVRNGDWKYIRTRDHALIPPKQGIPELKRQIKQHFLRPIEEIYNLKDDPTESRNLLRAEPERARNFRRQLDQYVAASTSADLDQWVLANAPVVGEAQVNERLRALGYIE